MDSIKYLAIILMTFLCISCINKSKTELYLERGLDILNNVKDVNFTLIEGYSIEKIGIVRDEKLKKKTIILILDSNISQQLVNKYSLGVKAEYVVNKKKVMEQWDFEPNLIKVKDLNYILTEIPFNSVHKINKVNFYLFDRLEPNRDIGNKLELKNLYTNND